MGKTRSIHFIAGLATAAMGAALMVSTPAATAAESVKRAPAPLVDDTGGGKRAVAIFAGGCFWGVEGVFSHVKGVQSAESGYAGGPANLRVDYEKVGSGQTGYAEAVRVTYDPSQVSYGKLLQIFFSVITDPTTLNYQGPDRGTQYRSALFPQTPEQARVAKAYLAQLSKAGLWDAPIVTKIEAAGRFQPAEGYHQDFMAVHPDHPYIRRWDAPKLTAFKSFYPDLYRTQSSS